MGHPYDVENATRLHVEWCRDLIDRTGLTTTNQTEPLMRAVMFELRRSIAPGAVIAMALPTAIAIVFGTTRHGTPAIDKEERNTVCDQRFRASRKACFTMCQPDHRIGACGILILNFQRIF